MEKIVVNPNHIVVKELEKRKHILAEVDEKKVILATLEEQVFMLKSEISLAEEHKDELVNEINELEEIAIEKGFIKVEEEVENETVTQEVE